MNKSEPKIITKEGAWWYVIWGYVVAGLTLIGVLVAVIVSLRMRHWGTLLLFFAVAVVLMVLLLIGVVFRQAIGQQKVVLSCKEKVKRAYNLLLMPLFGILVLLVYAVVWSVTMM